MRNRASVLFAAVLLTAGCTSTIVVDEFQGDGLPRPDRVLVYDFATSGGEIRLDRGLDAALVAAAHGEPRGQLERELGRKVADAIAEHLVMELRGMGLPAQRARGHASPSGRSIVVEGQIVSIDEGSRAERVIIGLGAGHSLVETHVRVYETAYGSELTLLDLRIEAESGKTPGAAETLGLGAATGHLVVSGSVTAVQAVGNETLGATVDADAVRTARQLAAKLRPVFEHQGWIHAVSPTPSLQPGTPRPRPQPRTDGWRRTSSLPPSSLPSDGASDRVF